MTGPAAQYGEEAKQGLEIGLKYVASDDALSSLELSYSLQDSQTSAKTAETALRTLIAIEAVPAVVTEVSGVVLALAPICERESIVQVNVGAQNPKIENAGDYTFSLVNLANVESKQVAALAFDQLAARRASVLYASESYGQGARDIFVGEFERLGGSIVASISYPVDGRDYRAQISETRRASPDVVYLPGTTQDMARALRQSYEMGYRPQWLSYTAFEGPEILTLASEAAEGVIFASAYLGWPNATGVQGAFRDLFKAEYGKMPSVYSATAFDAVLVLAKAARASRLDDVNLRDAIASMEPFQGASGLNAFRPNGTVNKPLVFKTVQRGQFVIYK